jgi:serine/threonine protein kinase
MEEYPLISEYIEAIKAAEDNFDQLKHLCPVLDEDGNPVMSSGNFAVVFKMRDKQTGMYYAVKCFLRAQEDRAEAYRMITEGLKSVDCTFLTPIQYLDKELYVYTKQTTETEFPVLLMGWVEGVTLDKYVRLNLNNLYKLALLVYQFSRLAMWLMPQPFAHGDLKPDNILVKEDGTLVLVDYDGMYVPAMKGQRARELGSPDFRHPSRTEIDFDEHIDDFSLASILLSLKAISLQPSLLEEYGAQDRLLFSVKDYRNIAQCNLLKDIFPSDNTELNILLGLFVIALEKGSLAEISTRLFDLAKPEVPDVDFDAWYIAMKETRIPYEVEKEWEFQEFIKSFSIVDYYCGNAYYSVSNGGEEAVFLVDKEGNQIIAYNQSGVRFEQISERSNELIIELRKSGHYVLSKNSEVKESETDSYSTEFSKQDLDNGWTDEFGAQYSSDGKYLFKGPNPKSSSYIIKEGTLVICNIAFLWNKSITKIHMPDSVAKIGDWAFHSCVNLKEINISNNIIKLDDSTFKFCRSLTKVILPESLCSVGDDAFNGCTNLMNVYIPDSLMELGYQAFYGCSRLQSIIIPKSVKAIGAYAFAGCTSLISISILGAPKIGDAIFYGCTQLKTIYIPSWTKRNIKDYLGEYYHLLDRTCDYPFTNSWSLKEFIDMHGDMKVEETVDEMTGEVFNLCVFANSEDERITARDYYYWGGMDITKLTGVEESFRIGEDKYGGYNLYDKTLDYWESGMIMEWQYD